MGEIVVELADLAAPKTVANFLRLVRDGAYDRGSFYRTVTANNQPADEIRIAVIQGGVNGGSDAPDSPSLRLERTNQTGLRHLDGTISMARLDPDSARTEFFICIGDQPELDYGGQRNPDGQGFAAFGQVVQGMEVVTAIHGAPSEEQRLTPTVRIGSIWLLNDAP
jgi:peptidyl-prolyl cis-trans isomerase A (cyclophilin A)